MKVSAAIAGGLAGACAVAAVHEGFRRLTPDAPRMDLLDMEVLEKMIKATGCQMPDNSELLKLTLAGEASGNVLYYALAAVGSRESVWLRSILLGLAAGATAVVLPKPLGLSEQYSNRTQQTKALTIGLYLVGGLVAGAVSKLVDEVDPKSLDM